MTDSNNCYAYFGVYGDAIDPPALSAELGVAPTQAWLKGELDHRRRERRTGHWALYSRLARTAELEEHLLDVLVQMDANAPAFAAVSQRFGGTLQLVGHFHDLGAGLNLSRDVVSRLAFYGVQLDLDSYYLYSDSRECTD
ncbi:DUF4279 domain-containing protein [Rhodanobacter sp. Root179]|uniref:DUF4279 domain-containing protein n=1 Tax=Rhodanobacter sp. Root179 TaxID=1736482 RepID=UPI0009E8EF3E|nr:DUF4279 domain-containing protein [Rhodanobacter sp. Root179]